ncbi:MAG: hypothetical protein JXA57_13275 [Armatimonadetes bacterium]|nr:hypothetical protein [Armatimonadota bacterium]
MICGMREGRDKGIPELLCGIPLPNPDQWRQCIENIIRDGTAPRVYGVQIGDPIRVGDDRFAVVIRIPRSFSAPHMVLCGDDRFYYRTNAGRARLDVAGLRTLFGMADTVATRTEAFRAERLSKIQCGDTPEPLLPGPKFVLHLVPFDAFVARSHCDLSKYLDHPEEVPNIGAWSVSSGCQRSRYTFEGVISCLGRYKETDATYWYTQCFRNGIIEAVNMQYNPTVQGYVEKSVVTSYEQGVLQATPRLLAIQRDIGASPPIVGLLTLLGVKNHRLSYRDRDMPNVLREFPGANVFREEHLVLPEVVFEDFECNVAEHMEPIFEIIWNAVGLSRRG